MTHPVLVAGFADEARLLASWCDAESGVPRSQVTAVGLDLEAQAEFRERGFETRNTIALLTEARHRSVFLSASSYARCWFRQLSPKTLELLSHNGISYPESLEYDISLVFTEILLHFELVRALLEQEQPDPLVVVNTDQPRVNTLLVTPRERLLYPMAVQVCALTHIQMRTVTPPKAFGANRRRFPEVARGLFYKARDIYQAMRIEERPLAAFLGRGLPVALSYAFPGKIVYERKMRRYRQASRKVLFWGGMQGNQCIREALQRDPAAQILALGEKRRLKFRQSLVPLVDPRRVSAVQAQNMATIRQQADAAWHSIVTDHHFQAQLQHEAIRLWPILQARLEFYVREHFPQCVEFYEATRNFLREQGGDVLVSTLDSGGFTPWICGAFSSMGKESIYFWHGLLIPYPGIEEGLSPAFLPLHAKRVAAFGAGIATWYRQNGVASDRIRLVGFPDLDSHRADLSSRRRRSICRILGLNPAKPIIVYATSVTRYGGRRAYSEETADEILRATQDILQELATNPELQVIIKLHPGLTARESAIFKQLVRPFSNAIVCQMPSLGWLVQLCEILITFQSSAGIEALACDRSVIIYNTTGRANQYSPHTMTLDDNEANFAVFVDDRDGLRAAVQRLLTDESLRERLQDKRRQLDPNILFNSDGRALDRAMQLVAEAAAAGAKIEARKSICPTKLPMSL